jgi:hypothetical protein
MTRREKNMAVQYTLVASIVFGGGLNPSPGAAEKALHRAGYRVTRMPEEWRSLLVHPRDYFMEVTKVVACEDPMDAASNMRAALDKLVRRYGAGAYNCRPIGAYHAPFEEYSPRTVN